MATRREFLKLLSSATMLPGTGAVATTARSPTLRSTLGFAGLSHGVNATHAIAEDYHAQILLRWGDALVDGLGAFDPRMLDAAGQAQRFGYNNDFVAYLPLPYGSNNSEHGLLCVNHEFTNTNFMWPNITAANIQSEMNAGRTATEIAAMGHSVAEIQFDGTSWQVLNNRYNQRVTAASEIVISGPAAGHARMSTEADPRGTLARGIIGACAGGKTPWGTVLIAEENFQLYFRGGSEQQSEQANYQRYGIGNNNIYAWWPQHFARFDLDHEPHEANRFGWVVELDPYEPGRPPVKRTALGRCRHEAATCVLNPDGRVVVYSGDDARFEYLYRFVSAQAYNPHDRVANRDLLDRGVLSVARFHDDGTLSWIPLRFGEGPLTPINGFSSEADVLIETRRAADLLGATRLDRPEDVETNPLDGCIYALMTNNISRTKETVDAANPRASNEFGHILKLMPPGAPGDEVMHAADEFRWTRFVLAGDPENETHAAYYPGTTADGGWFASPDNCAFSPDGTLWIATDQGHAWRKTGFADGLWAYCPTPQGGEFKQFLRAPIGAEVCGPEFTPDGKTLFVAIQHPGVDGVKAADFDSPGTRWPDFDEHMPPRPSVMAIRHRDHRLIGD